jgi:hypothetical protein
MMDEKAAAQIWNTQPQMENSIAACKSSRNAKDLHADIEIGATSAAMCQLANISYRLGGNKLALDPAGMHLASNKNDANQMLTRANRIEFRACVNRPVVDKLGRDAASLSRRVTYQVTNQWNVGFGAAMTIRNTGTTAINSWAVTWTWAGNQRITQSWNSLYTQTGSNARLANVSWNRMIQPGQTITRVGFNASYTGSNPRPTAFFLNGVLCSN